MAMHLANAISYITDEEKTQKGALVGSHNCNADSALQEMLATKRKFGKADKRQGYHFIISFKKQEVRPETAMEITQKFVERYFGDDFQCLYATHDNTEHVHSHILFNSVSWRTGRKYRYEKGDWAREIQPIVNELCKEYGLSIQDIEVGTEEKSLKKWDKTKQGIFKWNHQISLDVEDSISFANSYDNFQKLMELKGYEIKQKDGQTYLKPMGEKRFISLTDISAYYAKEAIENQIEKGIQKETRISETRTPRIVGCRKNYRKYIPQTPYQMAFFKKMYRTGQLKRKPYSQIWRYKEEAARFEKLQSQYLYLCRHNICSAEELEKWKKNLAIRMDDLDDARHQIYKRRYPHKPALALLKIIEENEIRASYYKQGSTFYALNYEKWKEAAEILAQKGYTINQISEMKESFQEELASVTKAKRELKKEEILINDILFEKNRVQAVEKIMPSLEAKKNYLELEEQFRQAREDAERLLEEREETNKRLRELEAENKNLHEQLLIQKSYAAGLQEQRNRQESGRTGNSQQAKTVSEIRRDRQEEVAVMETESQKPSNHFPSIRFPFIRKKPGLLEKLAGELEAGQIAEIRFGIEDGLTEGQLAILADKAMAAEKIRELRMTMKILNERGKGT